MMAHACAPASFQPELYTPDPSEALSLFDRALPPQEGVARRELEFSSRGDRVPALLFVPDRKDQGAGPHPLVLMQHGLAGAMDAPYMDARLAWVRAGAAVLSIDFPLHGRRASAKMSEKLVTSIAAAAGGTDAAQLDETALLLWREFSRQAVLDLRRALDAAATLPEIDVARCAYAGLSLGSLVGTIFCALDPRPRSAVLALGGGGFGPEELDPARHIAAIAPRPLLLLNMREDGRIPDSAARVLHEAAGSSARVEWFDGDRGRVPGPVLKAMQQFLAETLALR